MSHFTYIARSANGTMEKGTVEAKNPEAAREKLRKQQLTVEELQEEEGGTITFAGAMPWTTTDEISAPKPSSINIMKANTEYMPLTDTLRLFAGWLLAWYAVVYILGSFRLEGKLPFEIPFLEGLFASPIVLRFCFGTFLFLLLTSMHRWMGRGIGKAITLGIIGMLAMVVFHVNA